MAAASFLPLYLCANVLLLAACGMLMSARRVLRLLGLQIPCTQQLRAVHGLILLSLVLPVAATLIRHPAFLPAAAQVWSGLPVRTGAPAHAAHGATVSVAGMGTGVRLDLMTSLALAGCLGGLGVAAVRIGGALRSTLALIARAQLLRRRGTLRILASTDVSVPFSFWVPGCAAIVVPVELLGHAADLRIAIRHEGQHHRHGDTWGVYALTLLRGAFFLNPAAHLLCRQVHELQELACDAAVAGRRGVSTGEYCECLLRAAESALTRAAPAAWMHMSAAKGTTLLARRIRVLLHGPGRALRPSAAAAVLAAMLAGLAVTAVALPGAVQDRRISASQAQILVDRAQARTAFPITLNPEVLEQLNQLLGTPTGRDFMRHSLARMHQQEAVVGHELQQLEVPAELLAVPLVESGYRNLPPEVNPVQGAGIWQIIPRTARAVGLTVDDARDERMDVMLESQAAARLLSGLFAQLGDWDLAVLAYNAGHDFVAGSISKAGTRDAFQLTRLGYENDPHYLARVMAAIIILGNAQALSLE